MFLYEQNLETFGTKSERFILNLAMTEARTNPDINTQRIPLVRYIKLLYWWRSGVGGDER